MSINAASSERRTTTPVLRLERAGLYKKPDRQSGALQIYPGEIVALLGAAGSGKSQIVDQIAGETDRTLGQVYLNGVNVTISTAEERFKAGISRLPWNPSQGRLQSFLSRFSLKKTTVRSRVYQATCVRDFSREERLAICDEALKLFNLTYLADRSVEEFGGLSGGERRRLDFACVLASAPALLLLDSPFEGCDPPTCRLLRQAVSRFAEDRGAALVAVRSLSEALCTATRVCLLENKRIVADMEPIDLLASPDLLSPEYRQEALQILDTAAEMQGYDPQELRQFVEGAFLKAGYDPNTGRELSNSSR
ncbi:MAG: ATP-binding cassette domain-containing protein [Thermoguttaceae bacterium]